jgi:hypothetical protein
MMHQTLRELTNGAITGTAEAPFKVRQPDGTVREFKHLGELPAAETLPPRTGSQPRRRRR